MPATLEGKKKKNYYDFAIEKIIRCKQCCYEMTKESTPRLYFDKGYCSELCFDEEPAPIKGKFCILCGLVLISYRHKVGKRKGLWSGTYSKTGKCEECLLTNRIPPGRKPKIK